MLKGKTIIVGVSGGIAAYKAATICSRLVGLGAEVHVIMTKSATKFITPLTLQTLSRHAVHVDTFEELDPQVVTHIDLADRADLILLAPATANMIAKLAHGIADDMLSTTLLAATCPIVVAPAMNVHMYEHPAVVDNIKLLAERGVRFIDPGTGQLACGYVAKGRLAEPEEIVLALQQWLNKPKLLRGKKVLVTAGGTMERIDPVRYLTNDSSGKMGFAIAEAALDLGADVTVVAGRTSAAAPQGVKLIKVESAADMLQAVLEQFDDSDIVIKSAAVADYRPKQVHQQKLKKGDAQQLVLELERTTDILATLGERKTHQLLVGFAAETEQLDVYAMDKLKRKNCDYLVANDVSQDGAGFNYDTNVISIYNTNGLVEQLPLMSKRDAAERLLQILAQHG
ncbi:phosphopantothenoylcysteine decarboxylase [Paenibacillus montaniterrae]|uniref:Coenzyme A biosynthesis bifunctional protein CoaBC n=1 Tax=Paenibacillus montaniterrae TaxID=429341 RepID=A0A919YIE9_9BACL|nr:bifunctional phosphopantothenoylcysteine decarboxylase/phosphopantothenate--cysteine ligase CoaBC [Paenibacillus montaniterrae]GIP14473.1 phosphopantothenoylcysteine decarboxylase [Paenibacillus montaniterrae]